MNTPLKSLILLAVGWTITACAGGGPSPAKELSSIPTPAKIEAIAKPASDAATFVNRGLALIEDMQAGKVACTVAALAPVHEDLVQAKAALVTVNTALPEAVKSAKADASKGEQQTKQIEKLQKADPIVAKLNWIGVGLLVLSLGAIGAGIWLNIPMARNGGLAGAGVALGILTLATYLHTLEWLIGGLVVVCAIGGGVWWLLHHKVTTAKAADDAQWIPKPKGDTPWTPEDTNKAIAALLNRLSTPAPGSNASGAGALGNVMSTPASPVEGVAGV